MVFFLFFCGGVLSWAFLLFTVFLHQPKKKKKKKTNQKNKNIIFAQIIYSINTISINGSNSVK